MLKKIDRSSSAVIAIVFALYDVSMFTHKKSIHIVILWLPFWLLFQVEYFASADLDIGYLFTMKWNLKNLTVTTGSHY